MRLARTARLIASLVPTFATAALAQVPTPDNHVDADQIGFGMPWRVVRAPHFRVVFPRGMERDAQRVAAMLEKARDAEGFSIGGPPKPITVVLQHTSTESNGYVTLSPRHSGYVTAPPDFSSPSLLTTDDWLALLVIHEGRHVAQFDQTKVGFTRLLYTLFGETGQLIALVVTPGWVWEGDAVGTETALSTGGRGRSPSFLRGIRALALDDKLPEYYAAMGGSYTHDWPGPYEMGYLLTSRLKRTRPLGSVGRVLRGSSRHSYLLPLAFPLAVHREAGVWPGTLYDSTMREVTALWRAQLDGVAMTPATRLTPPHTAFTSYVDAHVLGDGTIVAMRTGFANIRQLVRLDSGRVTVLADAPTHGIRAGGMLVTWTQGIPDLRWAWRNTVEIRAFDVATKRGWRVGPPGRWASPIPSPDGKRIAAVETRELGGSRIAILDAATGAELRSYDVPAGEHAMDPAWRGDGNALVFTRQGTAGKALSVLELGAGTITDLIPHSLIDVYRPIYSGNVVLYVSSYSGIDNIYAIDTRSGARWQVTSRRVSAVDPAASPDGRRLLFGEYERMGTAVMETPLDSAAWTPIERVESRPFAYHEPVAAQERFVLPTAAIAADSATRYPVSSFRRPWHLFDVHSWRPILFDGEFGATLISNDVLNTLGTNLTYRYNANEAAHSASASASYAGFYPIIDVEGTIGTRSTFETVGDTLATNSWNEQTVAVGVRLPITLSRGNWGRGFLVGAHVERSKVTDLTLPAFHAPGNGVFTPVTLGARFGNRKGGALRDMATWGHFLESQYRYTPFGGDFHPRRFDAHLTLSAPTPLRHHGLFLEGNVEDNRDDAGFRFASTISRPRGYDFFAFDRRMFMSRVDYMFPIAYPDFTLGPLLFIPRITGGFFHDYLRASGGAPVNDMWSAGAELMSETALFGTGFLFPMGVRAAYRSFDRKWVIEPAFRSVF